MERKVEQALSLFNCVRNSAKAIIIKDEKLLAIKCIHLEGIFYILPGGGQNPGETLVEALKKECREEINAEIIVHNLRFIREYIGRNHEFAEYDKDVHQIEYMFVCELEDKEDIKIGSTPDSYQIGIEWLPSETLSEYRLYPKILKELILKDGSLVGPIYLGDVN